MLDRKTFLIKERVAFLKLSDTYDIFDPHTGAQIGIAHENVGILTKVLRLFVSKRLLPTTVELHERENGPVVLSFRRTGLLRSTVDVRGSDGKEVGHFKSKLFSIGGGFDVFDTRDHQVAEVKGDWKGWNFRFLNTDGAEVGTVTKKWAGVGKELFTSADNYVIALNEKRAVPPNATALLLAAGLAIDTVYKEK